MIMWQIVSLYMYYCTVDTATDQSLLNTFFYPSASGQSREYSMLNPNNQHTWLTQAAIQWEGVN